jgi:hypothetical protein
MDKTLWHETKTDAPPENRVVLGWWTRFTLEAVYRREREWFQPSYPLGRREPPLYWAALPDDPASGGERLEP